MTGVTTYIVGGSTAAKLNDSRFFFFFLTVSLLWITVFANVRGLGVGKWVNNIGGIGALVIGGALMIMGALVVAEHRGLLHWKELAPAALARCRSLHLACCAWRWSEWSSGPSWATKFATRGAPSRAASPGRRAVRLDVCRLHARAIDRRAAIANGGGARPAAGHRQMSASFGLGWILLPLAVLMAASIAGSTSAWVSGSARILFVCGLDRYLPKALGKIHPRHHSPHVALIMFGFLASSIIAMSFIGASVQEAYLTLLDLAVALQMISYIYLFLSLLKRAFSKSSEPRYFRRPVLQLASDLGREHGDSGIRDGIRAVPPDLIHWII